MNFKLRFLVLNLDLNKNNEGAYLSYKGGSKQLFVVSDRRSMHRKFPFIISNTKYHERYTPLAFKIYES